MIGYPTVGPCFSLGHDLGRDSPKERLGKGLRSPDSHTIKHLLNLDLAISKRILRPVHFIHTEYLGFHIACIILHDTERVNPDAPLFNCIY